MKDTVRIADYAPVKAVIDAAEAAVEAQGSAPWTLSEALDTLGEALAALDNKESDKGEGWEG